MAKAEATAGTKSAQALFAQCNAGGLYEKNAEAHPSVL